MQETLIPVLLPLALETPYDYRAGPGEPPAAGDFVRVPLGNRERIGVVWDGPLVEQHAAVDAAKLRSVIGRVDVPPLTPLARRFVDWVAGYTLAPPGMVLRMMMSAPQAFEEPKPVLGVRRAGPPPARMTAARERVLAVIGEALTWRKSELAEAAGVSPSVINALVDAGTLRVEVMPERPLPRPDPDAAQPRLTSDQEQAAAALLKHTAAPEFSTSLLDGVTGSGKTEVYFEAIADILRQGRQALILLPEIALTAQFLTRFEERFAARPAEWHSEMTPVRRARIWRAVAQGEARVVVGARSALFLPYPDLGLIVVDEEHDPAYKQQDRVCYQARDMAVVHGHLGGHPVILSSATP
ncbi:MAG: DEAD/DEAH box helicase, partial [Alphaproteobacteria bacterium]